MIRHTYDMGVVGNCAFLALIGTDTAVRWLCWPRFDSSFGFRPLLDEQKGVEFSTKPAGPEFTSEQRYLTNTNVLRTEITTAEGSYRVTDVAPTMNQPEAGPWEFWRMCSPTATRICFTGWASHAARQTARQHGDT